MNNYQNYKLFRVLIFDLDNLFCNFMQISCNLTTSSKLARIKSLIKFCGNIPSTCFDSCFLLEMSRDSMLPTCFSVCFSKSFLKENMQT